uniref:Uncharacterized protein n=1 Tax=Anguilla anguilla TaxID=7936 RepID=A0A0E9XK20_ANGAN
MTTLFFFRFLFLLLFCSNLSTQECVLHLKP